MEKVVIPFRMVKDGDEDSVNDADDHDVNVTMTTRCMDINIMAAMEAAELVLDRMSLANGGKGGLLVNTASLAGFFHCWSTFANSSSYKGIVPGWVQNLHSYFASKHAVVSMTRTLGSANVFKETGVKVPPVFSLQFFSNFNFISRSSASAPRLRTLPSWEAQSTGTCWRRTTASSRWKRSLRASCSWSRTVAMVPL